MKDIWLVKPSSSNA